MSERPFVVAIDDNKDPDHDSQTPEGDGKPKTYKNFEFLNLMKEYKKEFGDDEYYAILDGHGYKKSNTIPPKKMNEIWRDFKGKLEILKSEGGK